MRRFLRWTAIAAAVLLVAGCGGGGSGGGGHADEGKGADAASPSASGDAASGSTPPEPKLPPSLTSQHLDWRRCKASGGLAAPGDEWRRATLEVPLDWSEPDGQTMPSYAATVPALREHYDLVSWDRRGVGAGEGVRCRDDRRITAAEFVDATPDTPREEQAYLQDAADFAKGCRKAAGPLPAHVSSTDAARDMDLMRQVLGDDKLHYFDISHGTELGGVYPHLFPRRVGRLILDAVVDPTTDAVGHAENQARGFQRALDDYLKSTGQDPAQGSRKIAALQRRIAAKPLPTSSGQKLAQTLATTGIIVPLYSEAGWPRLTGALDAAQRGDGSPLPALADSYNERVSSGHYGTTAQSQRVISCLDEKERRTLAETKGRLARFERISPVFGDFLGWDTAGWCHAWPVPGQFITPQVSAPGAAPILLVGNGSDCVDSTVNACLLKGTVPKDGKVCS